MGWQFLLLLRVRPEEGNQADKRSTQEPGPGLCTAASSTVVPSDFQPQACAAKESPWGWAGRAA